MVAIGIDLGTTNSVGAYYDGKEVRILGSAARPDGLVPSVVAFRKPRQNSGGQGEIQVGQAALDFAYRDPQNTIFSIKRLMGRSYNESKVAEVRERVNYAIVPATDGDDPGVRVLLGGEKYTPVDISARILKRLKEDAERVLGEPVTHAVITVPAYFEERQRAATRQAGQQAGLVVKKIIDEPSAAAVAYGFTVSRGERQRLLVFDLGGGTFDVSIIMTVMDPKGKNHFEVLEISGDNWLGGDDFDREIVRDIVAWVAEQYGFDPSSDKVFQLLAKQAAEKTKKTLSEATEVEIALPAAYKTPDGEMVDLGMTITREHFETLIRRDVDRCMKHVHDALTGQGLTPNDIDKVLMIGGSTLIPLVYESVAGPFGSDKVQQRMNPYHAVALGAAILATTLQGIQCPTCKHVSDEAQTQCEKCGEPLATAMSVGDVSMTEVTAMPFGISVVRGDQRDVFDTIIPKGTVYPLRRPMTKTFVTTANDFIRIPVYEGVELVASKNEEQGVIELTPEDFRQMGEHVPANTQVDVSMNYTRDRELHIKVRVHGTKIEREFNLRRDRPRQVAPAAPSDDKAWRVDLENAVGVAEHFRGRYMGYMEPREQMRLDRDIERAQHALAAQNPVDGRATCRALVVTLDSCGLASLIFLAERVQRGASPERAKRIGEAIGTMKEKWYEGNKAEVAKLMVPLRAAIAAELKARHGQEAVPGQEEFGGKLRLAEARTKGEA